MKSNHRSIKQHYELLYFLTLKELKEKYKHAYLGFMWFLIIPFITLAALYTIFTFFFPMNVPNYAEYLLTGLIPWFFFSLSIGHGINSISGNANLVRKVAFQRLFLPASAALSNLLTYVISIFILVLFLAVRHQLDLKALPLLPVAAIALVVLIFNLTSIFAYTFVLFRDVRPIVELGIFLLFYATPIFYSLHQVPQSYAWVYQINPVCLIIELHRSILVTYESPIAYALPLTIWIVVSTIINYFTYKTLDKNIADFVA